MVFLFVKLYLLIGIDSTLLRLPRLLKVLAYWEFTDRLDAILEKPYFLRIVKTVNYMLYLIHINACAYYAISEWEGVGTNTFVYDGEGNAYIRFVALIASFALDTNSSSSESNVFPFRL